jgi:nucleotide-binding universal stress UspA family protein
MPYPWRRIVVPTDFSTAAEWAFDYAVNMAGATGAELLILHIRMTRTSNPAELRFPADPSVYEYVEQAELESLLDRARRLNATVQARMIVRHAPDPGAEICRTASQEHADLIVIATHARHHVAHLIIGSTTLEVLANPPAPVLAVRYGIPRRPAMHRIVVPVHAGHDSFAAVALAAALATRESSEIHLISVSPDPQADGLDEFLSNVVREQLAGRAVITKSIAGSEVERELIRYADQIEADLIVLLHDSRSAGSKIGPIIDGILRKVEVPVLLVPSDAKVTGGQKG